MPKIHPLMLGLCLAAMAVPANAGPRETLMNAAFHAGSVAQARADVANALAAANAVLARNPGDSEAQLQHALAIGYRAKLTHSAADARESRKLFKALVAANPRNPEAQLALAGWHLDAIADLGAVIARIGLGANKKEGLTALDRAVALGGSHALFPAYGALIRARLDPADPMALKLARQAVAAPAPGPLDRLMQQRAAALLKQLSAGNRDAAAALARRMLPFGGVSA
jgi:hypothetical protein